MADHRLAEAAQRHANPDTVFSDVRAAIEMGGAAERAAAAEHFRARADSAFRLYGLSAPPIQSLEGLTDYRRRLLTHLRPYSDQLRHVEFSHIPRESLPPFEKIAIEGAVELFERPTGPLRSCTRRDHSGRETTHWFGDESACWLPFTNAIADNGEVLGWRTGRVRKPEGTNLDACVPVFRQGRTSFDV